jgi:hypothetical protein
MHRGLLLAIVVVAGLPSEAGAQQPRLYAGATFNGLSHLDSIGSSFTSRNGAFVVGAASPRIVVEFEASFGGSMSSEYSYACCGGHNIVKVVTSTKDAFFTFQVKGRGHIFEPVAGIGFVNYRVTRHATTTSTINPASAPQPYFDDGHDDSGLIATGGLDAAIKIVKHFYFVPSARLIVSLDDAPAGTQPGRLRLRYGVGVRVAF